MQPSRFHEQLAHDFVTGGVEQWQPFEFYNVGVVSTEVIMRAGLFQAEIVTFNDNKPFPTEHAHPDMDSIDFILHGEIPLVKDGLLQLQAQFFNDLPLKGLYIGSIEFHGVTEGLEKGSRFLSFQRWLHGVKPSSALLNWQGVPLSLEHKRLLTDFQGAKWVKDHPKRFDRSSDRI